jgi:hypothetical protein
MVVSVGTGPTFTPGTPKLLFERAWFAGVQSRQWDWHPDGDRIVVVDPSGNDGGEDGEPGVARIHIIQNWFEELKERVPVP